MKHEWWCIIVVYLAVDQDVVVFIGLVTILVWAFDELVRQWGLGLEAICGRSDEVRLLLVICGVCIGRIVFSFFHLCSVLRWKEGFRILHTSQGFGPWGSLGGRRISGDLLVL